MKTFLIIFFFAFLVRAEYITLWDSRITNVPPATTTLLVDVGETDTNKNPSFQLKYRKFPVPGVYEIETGQYFPWTNNFQTTVDSLVDDKTNSLTRVQIEGNKELRNLKQSMGLSARASDEKLLKVLMSNSSTNTGAGATRLLSRGIGAYIMKNIPSNEE